MFSENVLNSENIQDLLVHENIFEHCAPRWIDGCETSLHPIKTNSFGLLPRKHIYLVSLFYFSNKILVSYRLTSTDSV